jgi:hypothetical protein
MPVDQPGRFTGGLAAGNITAAAARLGQAAATLRGNAIRYRGGSQTFSEEPADPVVLLGPTVS